MMDGKEIEAAISSLDTVLAHDPPHLWRPTCEKLQRELMRARKFGRYMTLGAMGVVATAFVLSEPTRLSEFQWSLLGLGLITAPIALMTRGPAAALSAAIGALAFVASLLPHQSNIWQLAAITPGIATLIAASVFPVLQHDDRVRALLVYFGLVGAHDDVREAADQHISWRGDRP